MIGPLPRWTPSVTPTTTPHRSILGLGCKTELLDRRRWTTRVELANAAFAYLEIFHNRQRRHSALGWLTPIQYEKLPTTNVA